MGKDLYDNVPAAKELFEKANEILGFRITDIMFAGTDEELKQTKVTQPAVFLHSVIMAKALGVKPDAAAGHSLGEFSALVVAGSLSFEDGLKLVSKRAMAMQAATEENQIPVVFSAVSDPVSTGVVESLEAPGANITGTSDYLDTNAVMELMLAADPDLKTVGLLYDQGQDSAATPIAHAKEFLDANGIRYVERTGTTTDEIVLAAQALAADGVDAVFTPTDNTVMTAELAIYETFIDAGIPHYTGADSFALNGAFLGYGVDYANLGVETANLAAEILVNGAAPASTPVMTFDNGTATINTETCAALGLDYAQMEELFAPLCTKVASITTAESFDELAG